MLSDSEHNYNQILNAMDTIGHAPPPLFFSQPSFVPSHDVVTISPIDSDQPTPLFFSPPSFAPSNDVVTICPIHNEQTTPMSGPEFQPSKKPRNEETPLISIPNPNPSTNSGNSGIFFKTRLCGKFKLATCPYGTNCNFAHGVEDLRKPPSNWYEFVGPNRDERMGNREDDHRIISKLKLCRRFYKGEQCPYGERCHFLHEVPPKSKEDPERFRESTAISVATTGSPWQNENVSDKPDGNGIMNSTVDSNLMNQKPWKTRMCNKWETMGYCPFGDKCHFAHGPTELQKFGCSNEAETANSAMVPSKPVPNAAKDVSLSDTAMRACSTPQMLRKKCLLKWQGPEKISRVYADWIDDLPLLQSSPSQVEH